MTIPTLVAGIDWTRDAFELQYKNMVISDGPYCYFRLEETAGVAPALTDWSGNGNDGTSTGTWAKTSSLPLAGAITGDTQNDAWYKSVVGNTQALSCPFVNGGDGDHDTGFTNGLTWEIWAYLPASPTATLDLLGNVNLGEPVLQINSSRQVLYASHSVSNKITTAAISASAWHHIVLRVEGTDTESVSEIYVDGVLAGSATNVLTGADPLVNYVQTPVFVARNLGHQVYVDEIALYDHDIGAGRVTAHYGTAGVTLADPSYTDIVSTVRSVSFSRGRERELRQPDTGEASVLVVDPDRRFEPENTESLYYPDVKPGRELYLGFASDGGTRAGQDVVLHGAASLSGGKLTLTTGADDYAELSSGGMSSEQGWVAVRFAPAFASGIGVAFRGLVFEWGDASDQRYIALYYDGSDWTGGRSADATHDSSVGVADTWSAGDKITLIMAWESTRVRASLNGAAFVNNATDNALEIPSLAEPYLTIGSADAADDVLDGDYYWILMGTGTLADADATTLNALGDTDPTLTTLGSTAEPLRLWTAASTDTTETVPATDLFVGGIRKFPFITGQPRNFVPLNATDLMLALSKWPITITCPSETTGARINRILDTLGIARAARIIDIGQETVAAETLNVASALGHIQLMADSEGGIFYINGSGWPAFHDSTHRTTHPRSTTSQWTYGDQPGGFELPYRHASLVLDDDLEDVYTYVVATFAAASSKTVTAASVNTAPYGVRPLSRTTRISTRAAANAYAQKFLDAYDDHRLVPREIRVMPAVDLSGSLWDAVRHHEISDRITVRYRPLTGGDMIEKEAFIESIDAEVNGGDPVTWLWTLRLSPVTGIALV